MLNPLLIAGKENAGILRKICSELGAVPLEITGGDWSLSLLHRYERGAVWDDSCDW